MSESKYLVDGLDVRLEKWQMIPGYANRYMVSNYGRVISLYGSARNQITTRITPRPLQLRLWKGYPAVTLAVPDAGQRGRYVHQLVLLAFVGERPKGYEAGHRDGNPRNNHLSNLEWISKAEQELDKKKHGRIPRGSQHATAKLSELAVTDIRAMADMGITHREIASVHQVSPQCIWRIVRKETWKHVV